MKLSLKILSIILIYISVACDSFIDFTLEGNGKVEVSSRYIIEEFEAVSLREDFDLEIFQYNKDSISIIAEYNLIPFINVYVKDNGLIIKNNENKKFLTNHRVKLKLYLKNLSYIENLYRGKIVIDSLTVENVTLFQNDKGVIKTNDIIAEELFIKQNGTNGLYLNGEFKTVDIEQVGSGDLIIAGVSREMFLSKNGSGIINSYNLNSKIVNLTQSGTGITYCYVDSILNINMNGGGRIFYKGNPKINANINNEDYLIQD